MFRAGLAPDYFSNSLIGLSCIFSVNLPYECFLSGHFRYLKRSSNWLLLLYCTMKFRGALVDSLLIICGILSAGMGLKGFLLPSHFIDGGVTGISILVADATHLPLSVLIFIINVPFL